MRYLSYVALILLIVPLQTTLTEMLSLSGIKPDLGLIAVFVIGYLHGEMDGLVVGGLVGVMMDLFSGGVLGANLVTKLMVGLGGGLLGRVLLDLRGSAILIAVFVVSLAAGCLFFVLAAAGSGRVVFRPVFLWIILPQALFDAASALILSRLLPRRARSRSVAWMG